jgi:hypothetical protein
VDRAARAAGAFVALVMASPAGAQDGVPKAPVRIDPVRGGVMLRDVVPVRRGATRMDGPPPWSPELLASVVPDPRVTALVSELASDDFATRERATRALAGPEVPDEQVWVHLARGGLAPEAHERLLSAGRTRIVDAPRGALGIQMAQLPARFGEPEGVTVTALIPNMPAAKAMKAGDRIVELDGIPVRSSAELTSVVQLKRPGQEIDVVVMRGERDALGRVVGDAEGRAVERRVELRMEVGSREDLDRFGDGRLAALQVDDARKRLADMLVEAFPCEVRAVVVESAAGEAPDVDVHPDIVQLRAQLARPEGLGANPAVRAVLRARLESLEAASRVPGLDPIERAWFRAVAERYRELLPPELAPD